LKLVTAVLAGAMLGLALIFLADLKLKYAVAFALLLFFPFFVHMVGSIRNALMAVLIFSLSTQMSFNPFYSDYYVNRYMGVRISLTGIILVMAYGVWMLEIFLRKRDVRFFLPVTAPLGLLVLWSGCTYFFALKPAGTVLFLFLQAVEGFLVYFYAANFIKTKEDIYFILRWVTVTVILTGMIATIQYFKPDFLNLKFMGWEEEQLKLYYGSKVITRPPAFLGHANNLAAFLVSWLPLLFIFILASGEKLWKHQLQIIGFLLGSVALVLSFSRGGWISLSFAVVLMVMILSRRKIRIRLPRFFPRLFTFIFIAVLLASPFIPDVVRRLTNDDYEAGASRIRLAKDALEVFLEAPVQGVGLGYYLDFMPIPPHNIYLQTAVETGTIGLVLFFMFSLSFFRGGIRALKETDPVILLFTIGALCGLSAGYLHGMVELGTIAFHKFLTYLFIGGILIALGERQKTYGKSNH
jgi:O-antigen ligase